MNELKNKKKMEENYSPFITFEEKNPRKFSIELEHPNCIGLTNCQYDIDKDINFMEEPSNDFIPNKNNTINTTNIFLINNIKDSNLNENKCSIISQNYVSNNICQNISEEKPKSYNLKENENSDCNQNNEYHSGRWTNEEHQKFIEGILNYGNEWKRVQSIIKTRSSTQARSHAQKFFLRMKKEINPKILSDPNQLVEYIISTSNVSNDYTNLSKEQKDRLFSVIRSNLKSDDNQSNAQYINQYYKEGGKGLDYIVEEDDNLAYNKDNIFNKKGNKNENGEKRKITFCSKKRKNSSDYILSLNENRIFNIKKDINHKKSMEVTKSNDNYINNLSKKNGSKEKKIFNEKNDYNQDIKNINNNMNINNNINCNINNNLNNNYLNNDKFINLNKTGNFNTFTNFNNTNFIIQNNFYNIINNYNNNGINNNLINNFQHNYHNTFLSNDSINSDSNNHNNKIYNNIDNFIIKDKNIKTLSNEILGKESNISNSKNILDNFTFLNNENFFPNFNKTNNNDRNFENIEQNDPFNLKFENMTSHNDNTIINDNMYLNNNSELRHETDDYEFNFGRNNNIIDRPYDD